MTPADRYFGAEKEVREAIEKAIAKNSIRLHFDTLTRAEWLALWESSETLQQGELMWWKPEKEPEGDDPEK